MVQLHLVYNEKGELLSFYLTKGNVDDRNPKHIKKMTDKILLRNRVMIETINDELKNLCQIEHTRHRSINNFIMNIWSGLTAYCFFPKKPSLNIEKVKDDQLLLGCA